MTVSPHCNHFVHPFCSVIENQPIVAENNQEADERGLWKRREVVVCTYIYTTEMHKTFFLRSQANL